MSYQFKDLPKGLWLVIGNLAPDATEEDLQKFMADHGVEVSLDRIRVTPPKDAKWGSRQIGFVSLPHVLITSWLKEWFGNDELKGLKPGILDDRRHNAS